MNNAEKKTRTQLLFWILLTFIPTKREKEEIGCSNSSAQQEKKNRKEKYDF